MAILDFDAEETQVEVQLGTKPKKYRKYSNRKFYDMETSKHANLGQIAAEVKAGNTVLVVSRNEEGAEIDITKEVLQTLVSKYVSLSTTELMDLIRK